MVVEAKDHGSPSLSTSVSVIIMVLDTNDNPPLFDKRLYRYINRFIQVYIDGDKCGNGDGGGDENGGDDDDVIMITITTTITITISIVVKMKIVSMVMVLVM